MVVILCATVAGHYSSSLFYGRVPKYRAPDSNREPRTVPRLVCNTTGWLTPAAATGQGRQPCHRSLASSPTRGLRWPLEHPSSKWDQRNRTAVGCRHPGVIIMSGVPPWGEGAGECDLPPQWGQDLPGTRTPDYHLYRRSAGCWNWGRNRARWWPQHSYTFNRSLLASSDMNRPQTSQRGGVGDWRSAFMVTRYYRKARLQRSIHDVGATMARCLKSGSPKPLGR